MAIGRQQLYDHELRIDGLLRYLHQTHSAERTYNMDSVQVLRSLIVGTIVIDMDDPTADPITEITAWYETEMGQWANRHSVVPLQVKMHEDFGAFHNVYWIQARVRDASMTEFLLKYS